MIADMHVTAVGYVQARNARANGVAKGGQSAWMGYVIGEANNDQVSTTPLFALGTQAKNLYA